MRVVGFSKRRLASVATLLLAGGLLTAVALPISSADAAVVASSSNVAPALNINGYDWVSYFRRLAGESAVTRNAAMEQQERVHLQYLSNHSMPCETNVHDELTRRVGTCGANPYATAAGKVAANNSNITRVSANVSDRTAVSNWFTSAFHALTLLDPRLRTTGYAAYYTAHPRGAQPLAWAFTAGVDVYRGRTGAYNNSTIAFPGNNASTPLLSYTVGTESPEPFATSTGDCRSWSGKSVVSAPVILQRPVSSALGLTGGSIIDVTTGQALQTCTLTAASYPANSVQRQFLNGTNGITKAAFYYASAPFTPGHRYTLKVGGVVMTTFSTAALPAGPKPIVTALSKSALVQWATPSAGTGTVISYVVTAYTKTGCNTAPKATIRTNNHAVRVLGLVTRRVYWIRVTAMNSAGSGRSGICFPIQIK
jgi:hypothetical protein